MCTSAMLHDTGRTVSKLLIKCWNSRRNFWLCSSPTSGSAPTSVRHCNARLRNSGLGNKLSKISSRLVLKIYTRGIHVRYTCMVITMSVAEDLTEVLSVCVCMQQAACTIPHPQKSKRDMW